MNTWIDASRSDRWTICRTARVAFMGTGMNASRSSSLTNASRSSSWTFCRAARELEGGCHGRGREHREMLGLLPRRVVHPRRVEERRLAVHLRLVPHLHERRVEDVELVLQLLDEGLGALVESCELHLRGLDRRLEVVLDDLDRIHDLVERRLGHAALAIEHTGDFIIHLKRLMLQGIETLGMVVGRVDELFPRHAVELVLPAEVAHEPT